MVPSNSDSISVRRAAHSPASGWTTPARLLLTVVGYSSHSPELHLGWLLLDRLARGSVDPLLMQQARPGGGDLTQRCLPALEPGGGGELARLEGLVDIEEMVYFAAQVGRHVVEVPDLVPAGIAQRNADDLGVRALLVFHPEDADWPDADPAPGEDRLLQQHHGVERVTVLGERVGDETVVGRVDGGGEQPPVQVQYVAVVVELVLVPAAPGHLDDHLDRGGAQVLGVRGHRPGGDRLADPGQLGDPVRGHSPASSRENTSSLVPTPSTTSS